MRNQFVICIKNDDPDLLTPRMIYQILPDESAAQSHYLRVIDNEGEDYLYPEEYFLRVSFPDDIEYTLLHLSPQVSAPDQETPDRILARKAQWGSR
jgi:hypothetical protein